VALQLRLLLSRGTWVAIATVINARGAVVLRPGTVLVVTEAGENIGSTWTSRSTRPSRAVATSGIAVSGLRLA
jgi:hypothetical protein